MNGIPLYVKIRPGLAEELEEYVRSHRPEATVEDVVALAVENHLRAMAARSGAEPRELPKK